MRRLTILALGLLLLAPNSFAGGGEGAEQSLPTAKGRTGPVGLQLTLLRNKIKVGERLFVKTTLINYANEPMPVIDWIYRGSRNIGEEWSKNSCFTMNPVIEIRDPKGHRLKPVPYADLSGGGSPFIQGVSPVDAKTERHIKDLESQGLPDAQINARLAKEEGDREEAKRDEKYPVIKLKHGQSVESVSWCSPGLKNDTPTAAACPGAGFVQLPIYEFDRPGLYRVRATRDHRLAKEDRRWATPWNVSVATGWITFEVIR